MLRNKRPSPLQARRWACPLFLIAALCGALLPTVLSGTDTIPEPTWATEVGRLSWRGWVTVAVFCLVLISLVREILPPDVTMISGAAILVLAQVITPSEFMIGFSRRIVVVLAMLFIIVKAAEVNGVLSLLANLFLPKKGGHRRHLSIMLLPLSVVSAFLNNTPIVLMLTTVVRRWAREMKTTPSKYLMPISFAAILGGMCTLIGTSPNLVVDGLLESTDPAASFGFFDLALIGIPCVIVGYVYLVLLAPKLLPDRLDPAAAASTETRKFTSEFSVLPDCPLIGKTVMDASRRYFHGEFLIEIVRDGRAIRSPSPRIHLREGDRLVFVTDIDRVARLHAIQGLESLADPKFQLDITSPYFSEVVVAISSWLIGKTLRKTFFRSHYNASVVAIYRQGKRVLGPIGDVELYPGDTLLLLSNEPWRMEPGYTNDFYTIQHSRELPVFRPKRALILGVVLLGLVVSVTLGVSIFYASMCGVAILLLTRSLSLPQARRGIDWSLLLLVAGAFALGNALNVTGVAYVLSRGVLRVVGSEPHLMIGGIFLLTMIVTEVITNVAAAMMIFPIALEVAHLAGYDSLVTIKAIGVTVAIAASSSFLTPIGYQTNTIIYGPGGYRFLDYMRLGAGLSVAQVIISSLLIPVFWPLS